MATSTKLARSLALSADQPSASRLSLDRDSGRRQRQLRLEATIASPRKPVEIWPGRGWYMKILARYLREQGKYYAAIEAPDAPAQRRRLGQCRADRSADAGPARIIFAPIRERQRTAFDGNRQMPRIAV
jgi:predicted methyltransferase